MQPCIEEGPLSIRQPYKNNFLIILFSLMEFMGFTDKHGQYGHYGLYGVSYFL
jgi:hypothetical protein